MSAKRKNGFTLIEVNMAIFVMATAVLAAAMLFPMGLRESILSQSDFKQVMFADYVLNIAVATACSTNVSWQEWRNWIEDQDGWHMKGRSKDYKMTGLNNYGSVPLFMRNKLDNAIKEYSNFQHNGPRTSPHILDETYAVYCVLVPGFSDQIMGIMVQSLEMDTRNMKDGEKRRRLEMQPMYYAEARFQGKFEVQQ